MRILIDYRAALRERTGVGEYVHELVRALAESSPGPSEDLVLFSASWKDRLEPGRIAGTRAIDRRIPVRWLNLAWHRLRWPAVERLTGERFDVVQTAHPLPMPARTAAQIVTVHDLDFLDHPERTRREIRRDYPALAPAAVGGADHVLVNSEHTAGEVHRRLGVPRERLSVCRPGAPPWAPRVDEPRGGYILFLGTLEPRKNVGLLIDGYERLLARGGDPPRLVFAGATPPASRALLARLAAPPLAGHVEVRGYVDPARRLDVYSGALVLVLPSHTEGFGLPALEAMTLGVPVIAANRGALPEVVGDAGLLIEPDDDAELAERLGALLGDRALRDRLREAGWRRARTFRWSESAARVREAWSLAVERRRRRG